jgi:hypothetical protein
MRNGGSDMNEALDMIYDTLDVFSGGKKSLKENEPGLVDLMDAARNREKTRKAMRLSREENENE